ncbi:MAG TPA: ATP-binding domain-containing protein, partial [Bacteroidia bacterium]|nr:ATP-binding domain-containing protein [Bacteroidia bacterium]
KAVIKGREVGENLVILIRKTKATSIDGCLRKIGEYETDLRLKLIKKGVYKPDQHKQMFTLVEKKEIIKILGEQVGTIDGLIKRIKEIFTDGEEEDGILLSSIHRAKGGEWERVWFLNSFLIPSVYATSEEELRQESNLSYVAITRAKKELIYINIFQDEEEELAVMGEQEL